MIIALCLLLVPFTLSFSTDWSTEFDYETYIDENQLFKLYWTDLPDDIIEFGIEVESTGWIALGVSPRGQMPSSDIAIGWVDDDGMVYLQDRYTNGRTAPLYDSNQNLTLIEGEEADGMTRIRFTRPKYSCDPQDLSLSQGTSRLIWAFHATDDPEEECWDSSSIGYHTNKGSQSINLDSGIADEVELEDDVSYIDILMDDVALPATDTTYYCKLFQLPVYNETQYVVKFEMVVEDGNEGFVHHLIAYYCPADNVPDPSHVGTEGVCNEWDENMPSRDCRGGRMVYGWAIGGNDLYMPRDAALPLSGDSGLHYVLIEMHYDNPLEKSGVVDSSGFRMYVTPTPRQYDVGLMMIGLSTNPLGQYIPPGLNYAHNVGFMTGQCSNNTFPEDGIKVFGSILHQHTIGRALNFRHIRDGKELAPIDTNLNYDFNYQQAIVFDEHITILPGDSLILECWTNSSLRTEVTIGGESSSQEMCLEFLYYYPAVEMTGVFVAKEPSAFKSWMVDAQQAGYLSGNADDIQSIFDGDIDISSLTYDGKADGAEEFYNRLYSTDYDEYNRHNHYCVSEFGGIVNTDYTNISIPNDFEEYDIDILSCDDVDDSETGLIGQCMPYDATTTSTTSSTDVENPNNAVLIKGYLSIFSAIFVFIYYLA